MSELRDARLQRALASAPDADLRPEARTREAVRQAAMAAVGGAAVREAAPVQRPAQTNSPKNAPTGWRRLWSALWPSAGTAGSARHMPWNAALATVLLASLVTLLWREQDIPGAEPGLEHAGQPAPAAPAAPAAAPMAAAPPTPGVATQPSLEVATRPAPKAATSSAPEAAVPAGKTQQAATADASSNATAADVARPASPAKPSFAASPAPAVAERRRDARSEPLAETAPAAPAAPAVPAREDRSAFAKSAPPSQAPVLTDAVSPPVQAPPLPAPVPAPAVQPPAPTAPAALSAAAPAAKAAAPAGVGAAMSRRAEIVAPMPDAWTQARILDGSGRGVQVDRAQAPALAGLLRDALAAGPAGLQPFGPATLRLELLQGGQRLGVLEVAGPLLRWTPAAVGGAAGQVRLVQPDAAALQALVDELARWAGR